MLPFYSSQNQSGVVIVMCGVVASRLLLRRVHILLCQLDAVLEALEEVLVSAPVAPNQHNVGSHCTLEVV